MAACDAGAVVCDPTPSTYDQLLDDHHLEQRHDDRASAPGLVLQGALPADDRALQLQPDASGFPAPMPRATRTSPARTRARMPELQTAEAAGDLVGLKDTNGGHRHLLLGDRRRRTRAQLQCIDDTVGGSFLNWEYATAHTGTFAAEGEAQQRHRRPSGRSSRARVTARSARRELGRLLPVNDDGVAGTPVPATPLLDGHRRPPSRLPRRSSRPAPRDGSPAPLPAPAGASPGASPATSRTASSASASASRSTSTATATRTSPPAPRFKLQQGTLQNGSATVWSGATGDADPRVGRRAGRTGSSATG